VSDEDVNVDAVIGVDIGGSGIKGALVDTARGQLIGERQRVATPSSLSPKHVLAAVVELVGGIEHGDSPLGIGFPAVVTHGIPRTGFTAHQVESWVGFPVSEQLASRTGRPVALLNDADAAGIAEMRFGAGRGEPGVVLVLTLGTGIGSALFVDGRLVPNTELGNLFLQKHTRTSEMYASAEARKRDGLEWAAYAARLDEYLTQLVRLFTPELIIIGGGISKRSDKFIPHLEADVRMVPAALGNQAGIIGAAIAAADAHGIGSPATRNP